MALRRIRIPNPELSSSQKTYLGADYTSGTSLTVLNTAAWADNDYAVVGEPGAEKTEQKDVTSIASSTSLTISSALNFTHNKNTPVYRSSYNAVEISYNIGSGWVVLSDLTTIQWDQNETIYEHEGGTSTTQYRFRFRNVAASTYSEYSPTVTGAGFAKTSIGYYLDEFRLIIGDPNGKIITDSEFFRWISRAKDIIKASRSDWWFWEKEDQESITTTAGTSKYDLDTISDGIDFIRDVRIRVYDGTIDEIYQLQRKGDSEFDYLVRDQSNDDRDDYATFYNLVPPDSSSTSGYIRIYPIPENTGVGRLYVRYYESDDDYDDVSDTITVPLPQILMDYALFRGFKVKGDEARAKVYEEEFFGPTENASDNTRMTGIKLLEYMQAQKRKAVGEPKVIKKYIGRKATTRLYRDHYVDRDIVAEKYW